MADERADLRRIDIALSSGQVLSLRVREQAYADLRRALVEEGGGRWHEVATEDSAVAIDLSKVDYLQLETETHPVGF